MVSDSTHNGEATENHPHGMVIWITVDIEGASAMTEFEVIEIVDDSNPYLALLGIPTSRPWEFTGLLI